MLDKIRRLIGRVQDLTYYVPRTTIPLDGRPYLTRYFLAGRDAEGVLKVLTPNRKVIGEGWQLFVHHFHMSDQDRELHNHPWTGTSLILAGGYREERMEPVDFEPELRPFGPRGYAGIHMRPVYGAVTTKLCRPGTVNRLGIHTFHRAELLDEAKGCWTLFLTGQRVKHWGFMDRETHTFSEYRGKHARGMM